MCKSPSPSPKLCSSSSLPHTPKVLAAQCSNRSRKWCFSHSEGRSEEVFRVWNWGPGHLFANPLLSISLHSQIKISATSVSMPRLNGTSVSRLKRLWAKLQEKFHFVLLFTSKNQGNFYSIVYFFLYYYFFFQRLNETLCFAWHIFHTHWFNHSLQKQQSWFHTIHCLLFGSLIKASESLNSGYLVQ